MFTKQSLFFLILLNWVSISCGGSIFESAEEFIHSQYPKVTINKSKLTIPANLKTLSENHGKQRFFRDNLNIWSFELNGQIKRAVIDNSMGKAQPFTFIAIYNHKNEIENVHILKYRESHGGQIANPNWLKQFFGKGQSSGFEFRKDIDGISGATISSDSMSRALNKLTFLMSKIFPLSEVSD